MSGAAGAPLVLRRAGGAYALPQEAVEDVLERPAVTPLAGVPPRLAGVVRWRGSWLPALWLDEVAGSGDAAASAPAGERAAASTEGGAGVAVVLRRGRLAYALLADALGEGEDAAPLEPERLFRAPLPAALAREVIPAGEGAAVLSAVTFRVQGAGYAVPMETVREVVPARDAGPGGASPLTRVVETRRGRVPVLDLRARFGLPSAPDAPEARVVVVETAEGPMGLAVDAMGPVVDARADAIVSPPERVAGPAAAFLEAVVRLDDDELLLLLRPDRLLPPGVLTGALKEPD